MESGLHHGVEERQLFGEEFRFELADLIFSLRDAVHVWEKSVVFEAIFDSEHKEFADR